MKNIVPFSKVLIITLLLAIIIVLGSKLFDFDFFSNISFSDKKWDHISEAYMDDFNGDGKKQEILLIYKALREKEHFSKSKPAAMKLINVETKEEIWTSSARPSYEGADYRIVLKDSILAMVYMGNSSTSLNLQERGVETFNCKTGEKILDIALDSVERHSNRCKILKDKENFYVFSENIPDTLGLTSSVVSSINIEKGSINWKTELYNYDFNDQPKLLENKIIVPMRKNLFVIDKKSGDKFNLIENKYYGEVFTFGDSLLVYEQGNKIFAYDSIFRPIKKIPELIDNADFFIAKDKPSFTYKNRLIYSVYTEKSSYIEQVELFKNEESKKFHFPDSFHCNKFVYDILWTTNKEIFGIQSANYQYIPMVLAKRKDEVSWYYKFAVFDLDSNNISFSGKMFDSESYRLKPIFYHKGYYSFILTYNDYYSKRKEFIVSISAKKQVNYIKQLDLILKQSIICQYCGLV